MQSAARLLAVLPLLMAFAKSAPAPVSQPASNSPPAQPNAPSAAAPASAPPADSKTSPVQLQKVEVTANQQQFYNSIDRKVYEVGKDVISTTGSASDLLQNVPSIQVDVEGNVSLRGDPGVEILINGKPSAMLARNRAAALEQLPASEIQRVEVITNPSARFRPDGTGGIINLIMKRGGPPGYSGTVRANAGNDERYNAAVNLGYNRGRYTLHGSVSVRHDNRPYLENEDRSRFDPGGLHLGSTSQLSTTERTSFSRFVRLGAEFKPDDATKLGASIDYDDRDSTRRVAQQNVFRGAGGSVTHDYERLRLGDETESEVEVALTFERRFSGRDHELSAELRLGRSRENDDNRFSNRFRIPEEVTALELTEIRNDETDTDLAIDYTRGLAGEAKLALGYEGERETSDLDFRAAGVDAATGTSVSDLRRSNRFIYEDMVHALYATYARPFGKLGVLGGLRLEHVSVDTNQVTSRVAARNQYARAYPSLHLNYELSAAHELQLSYSHRVNRPDEDELNPFIEYDDPFNLRAGNPALVPEDVHSVEAGYQFDHHDSSYLASVYFRRRENGFTEVTRVLDANTVLTTDENLSTSQSVGLELGATTRFRNRLALNFSANAYHQEIDAANLGFAGRRTTLAWNAKLNTTWEASDRLLVQLTTGYTARRLTAQGERLPSHITNLGLRYDLKNERTSLVLTVSDVFNSLRDRTTLDTPGLKGDITRHRTSQVIFVGLIHHFGRAAKEEKSLEFDEAL